MGILNSEKYSILVEQSMIPLEYIIQCRQIVFLKYNVSQEASELIKKILLAQVESPLKNNWWLDVESDLASFNINMSLEEIKNMEKESFAKLVKEKCRETIFKDLMAMKSTHSKMENLKYDKFEMSQYLKVSDKWSASSAYKFQTRMSEVAENFRGKYGNNNLSIRGL